MAGFSSRFLPDFATIAEPLRALSWNAAKFEGKEAQEKAFNQLKEELAGASPLAYLDKTAHIADARVIADASPVGFGAVIVQEVGGQGRAVRYASRSLSYTERRYSQTEKETMAFVWACQFVPEWFTDFDLVTDHQTVKTIYGPRSKPSARIERWMLRLQPYK